MRLKNITLISFRITELSRLWQKTLATLFLNVRAKRPSEFIVTMLQQSLCRYFSAAFARGQHESDRARTCWLGFIRSRKVTARSEATP